MHESTMLKIKDNKDIFGVPEDELLFITVVGSHMWGMEHEGSDIDLFIVRRDPIRDVLVGDITDRGIQNKIQIDGIDVDYSIHEVGKVVKMLIRNNPNFIWGVTSPMLLAGNTIIHREMMELADILMSKEIYKPIQGMVTHNIEKYSEDLSEKRCNTIARSTLFGINALTNGLSKYEPVKGYTPDKIVHLLDRLNVAYKHSTLPEKPWEIDVRVAKQWLCEMRLSELPPYKLWLGERVIDRIKLYREREVIE